RVRSRLAISYMRERLKSKGFQRLSTREPVSCSPFLRCTHTDTRSRARREHHVARLHTRRQQGRRTRSISRAARRPLSLWMRVPALHAHLEGLCACPPPVLLHATASTRRQTGAAAGDSKDADKPRPFSANDAHSALFLDQATARTSMPIPVLPAAYARPHV